MSSSRSKKYFIITDGRSPFPPTGKDRVRVFEEGGDDPTGPSVTGNPKQMRELLELGKQNIALQAQAKGTSDQAKAAAKEYAQALIDEAKALREVRKAQEEGNEVAEAMAKIALANAQQTKAVTEEFVENAGALQELVKEYEEYNEQVDAATEKVEKLEEQQKKLDKVIQGFSSTLNMANLGTYDFSGGLLNMTQTMISLGQTFNETNINLRRNTGLGMEAVQASHDLVAAGADLGVSMSDAGEIIGSLNQNMSGYVALSEESRKSLEKQAAGFKRLGVDVGSYTTGLDLLTRSAGMTAAQAETAMNSFEQLGQKLRLPTKQLVDDFAKVGPKMARFGKNMDKEFEKLAEKARSMGVDIQAAFDIGEAFDTFEGAADLAGKLNAQLGLQINSVEMMKLGHADRLSLLQKEFAMQGKNWDDMGRREQQAVAEMMGIDESMAAKVFGDPVEYAKYKKDLEETQARQQAMTTITEKLTAAGERLMVAFGGVFEFMAGLAEAVAFLAPVLVPLGALIGLYKTFVGLQLAFAKAAQVTLLIRQKGLFTSIAEAHQEKITAGMKKLNIPLKNTENMVDGAGNKIRGSGILLRLRENLAQGASNLLGAGGLIIKLKDNIASAAGNALRLVRIGIEKGIAAALWLVHGAKAALAFITNTLSGAMLGQSRAQATIATTAPAAAGGTSAMGAAATVSAGQMLAFGAAILLVGAGIAIAAYGMSLLVSSFAALDVGQIIGATIALGILGVTMTALAIVFGILIYTGVLAGMVGGMLAFGAAVLLMGVGVAIAAYGMSLLVATFAELDPLQIVGAALAIGILSYAMVALAGTVGLLIFTGALGAMIGGFAALGASLILLGIGTVAASVGITMLVGALQLLGTVNTEVLQPVIEVLDILTIRLFGLSAGIITFVVSMGLLIGSMFALAAILANPLGGLAFFATIFALANAFGLLSLSLLGIAVAADGLEAITKVVEVTTEASPESFDNLDAVLEKMAIVQVESKNANVPALEALAKAIAPLAGGEGAAAAAQRPIELKIDGDTLAKWMGKKLGDKHGVAISDN